MIARTSGGGLDSFCRAGKWRPPLWKEVGAMCVVALIAGGAAQAAESLLLNESAADACYQAALRGDDARDIEVCNTALEHQPMKPIDYAATLSNRGLLLSRSERFEDALADHNRAIGIEPGIASLYVNRSNTYTRSRRYEEAMRDLDRAIELAASAHPGREAINSESATSSSGGAAPAVPTQQSYVLAAAHFNRALLHQRQGNFAQALEDARQASQLAPDRPAYQQYLEELEAADEPRRQPGDPVSEE
jgi:tetratricopeptide (TPR) repeat protein